MKFRWSNILLAGTGVAAIFLLTGYWYVFIAGAPQLDPPQVEKNTGLSFEIKTFNRRQMKIIGINIATKETVIDKIVKLTSLDFKAATNGASPICR